MLALLTSFISSQCLCEELQLVVMGRTGEPGLAEEQGCALQRAPGTPAVTW